MSFRKFIVAVVALAASIGYATAQTTPPPDAATPTSKKAADEKDIVITGRKPVDAKQALAFARDVSAPVDGQLSRYNATVCPAAAGFSAAVGAQLVQRMRDVAAAAGARLEKPGCRANMLVIAAQEGGAAMLRQMRKRNANLIVGIDPHELNALIKSVEPVRSWTVSTAQNSFGEDAVPDGSEVPMLTVYLPSHISPTTEQTIVMAVTVIDATAMYGKTTRQIADYAAMRTLARTRPITGKGPIDTILALFDPQASAPSELSQADLVYLQSLYRMPGSQYSYSQIGQIAANVRKASKEPDVMAP